MIAPQDNPRIKGGSPLAQVRALMGHPIIEKIRIVHAPTILAFGLNILFINFRLISLPHLRNMPKSCIAVTTHLPYKPFHDLGTPTFLMTPLLADFIFVISMAHSYLLLSRYSNGSR